MHDITDRFSFSKAFTDTVIAPSWVLDVDTAFTLVRMTTPYKKAGE
jgi:hypothetical protein